MKPWIHLIFGATGMLRTLTLDVPAATIFRVDNYVSVTQSPFYEGIQNGSLYFNNFETSDRSYPSLTFAIAPRYTRDVSIDRFYNPLLGISSGHAMRTGSSVVETFILNFAPDANGHYPRYFGMAFPAEVNALTGFTVAPFIVPTTESQNRGNYELLGVKDAFGNAIFTYEIFDTPVGGTGLDNWIADDPRWGTFFGLYNDAGISQVTLYSTIYLDHLQYGYAIPEPSGGILGAAGILSLARRRRQLLYHKK